MNLNQYYSQPGAKSMACLREAIGAASDAQVSQWRHGYADRRPSPENYLSIEKATEGAVTVEELRPAESWARIADTAWPHPAGRPVIDFAAECRAREAAH